MEVDGHWQTCGEWAQGRKRTNVEGRKGWENDIKKEAKTTERDRNKWEKEEGKTVRNLSEVERRSAGALFIITPKLAVPWGGVSAALGLSFKNLEQGRVRLWNQTTQRGNQGPGPYKRELDSRVCEGTLYSFSVIFC